MFESRDFDDNVVSEGAWAKGQIEFWNNYSWNANVSFNPQTVNNRRTRGGPLTLNRRAYNAYNHFDTDGKAKLFYYLETIADRTEAGSSYLALNPGMEWKPVSSLSVSVGPSLERTIEDAQYVTTVSDPLATATYGNRYVFATLDQHTISAQIRLNWAFTPRMSLQSFIQPLISSGAYHDFKELARPRSYDFLRYGAGGSTFDPATLMADPDGPGPAPAFSVDDSDNHDFNIRTLKGNAVLRWEYLPGSTLFLVWTQNRDASTDVAGFDVSHSFDRLANARSENVYLAKVTYYFNR